MGDSPIFNTLQNVAGYGVGTLAALTTIKSGGLGNYIMNRQRMLQDPNFRASLEGSPFTSGFFGVSGSTGAAPALPQLPAAGQPVAQPSDVVGPPAPGQQVAPPAPAAPGQLPAPTAMNVPGYEPGTGRAWHPYLSPYEPKTALEQQGLATTEIGVTSPDPTQRAQFKMAGGIPLNQQEQDAAVGAARRVQALGGPGTVVQLDIPGMKTNVGSPYNFSTVTSEEYPTPQLAAAAAAARNANIPAGNPQWQVVPSGRGTYLLAPPATQAQTMPAEPPAPVRAAPPGAPQPAAPVRAAPPPPAAPAPAPAPAPAAPVPPPPPPAGVTRLAPPPPPPPPPQPPPQPPAPPPTAAAPPPPPPQAPPSPPPPPPAAAAPAPAPAPPAQYAPPFVTRPPEIPPYASPVAPPTASPLTPYIPPGTPKMAPSVRVAPGSPPMGGRVGYPPPAFVEGAAPAPEAAPAARPAPPAAAGAPTPVYPVQGFVVHHSGGSSLNALVTTLQQRGLGSQYLMDRDGTIYAFGGAGARQMQPNDKWGGIAPGLSNHNSVGMEVVAKDDKDVTPAQVASARAFIGAYYPNTPVYGHGEVNPGHKQASEGMTIVNAVRDDRATAAAAPPVQVASAGPGPTVAYPSPGFVDTGAPGEVGYPSPAPGPVDYRGVPFRTAVPDLSPTALGLPPPPRAGVPADIGAPTGTGGPPLFPLVDPKSRLPLSSITEKGSAREQTYAVPSPAAGNVAANMQAAGITDWRLAKPEQIQEFKRLQAADEARQKVMDADIARARGATPAANMAALNVFNDYRQALNTYLNDFPNPEDRAKYMGWLNRGAREVFRLTQTDPQFEKFRRDTDAFQYKDFNDKKGVLSDDEQKSLGNLLPTGHEANAISHEERLQGFNDIINARLGMRSAQLTMAPNEITPAWWNAANKAITDQAEADKQSVGGGVAGGAVGAALAAPPPAAPPPGPPPTIAAPPPSAPPPFTVLGHWQE